MAVTSANCYSPRGQWGYRRIYTDLPSASATLGAASANAAGTRVLSFGFTSATAGGTFKPPRGTIACAWQPSASADDTAATLESGGITFSHTAAGYLHCLVRGSASTGSSTLTPIARGVTGYISPRVIVANERAAVPNLFTALANGTVRAQQKNGLQLLMILMTSPTGGDTWDVTSRAAGLLNGIVAVAWQSLDSTDNEAVTLNASGGIDWSIGNALDGLLWVWMR